MLINFLIKNKYLPQICVQYSIEKHITYVVYIKVHNNIYIIIFWFKSI